MKKFVIILFIFYSFSIFASQKVIGVSAFKNLSKNKEYQWLSTGIAESISFKLRNVKQYIIVDRTNVDRLFEEIALAQSGLLDEEQAPKAGKILGANIIVIGNYQTLGNQIRINAKLVETETHKVLKQVMVTGDIINIFSLQDEIALKIISETNTDVSKKEINRIKKRNTNDLDAYKYYAAGQRYLLEKAKYKNAISMFEKAIEIDPDYGLAYSGLSKAWSLRSWELNNYENINDSALLGKAYKYAKKAISITPDIDESYLAMAIYYKEVDIKQVKDKWKQSEKFANKALKINPNNALAYLVLSNIYAYDNSIEEKYLKKAIEKNPAMIGAYFGLGNIYLEQKNYSRAQYYFNKVIALDPDYKVAYMNLGVIYSRLGKNKLALENDKIVVKRYPNYPKGLLNLAISYRKNGDYDNAIKTAKKLIKLKQKIDKAYEEIGVTYTLRNNYRTAIKYYKLSLKHNAKNIISLLNIGQAYYQLKDYNNSEKYYNICITHYPDEAHAYYMLGLIQYYKYHNLQKSLFYLRKANQLDPKSQQYKNDIRFIEKEKNK